MNAHNPAQLLKQFGEWLRRQACSCLGCPVPTCRIPLEQQAKELLERKKYTTVLPVLQELVGSFDYNERKIQKKVEDYKLVGHLLLFAIPIFSTLIAFMANASEDVTLDPRVSWLAGSVPFMSLVLALLTVVNSIVKPAVRFDRCCRIGVDLFHWRCSFLEGLEKLDPMNDKKLLEFLINKRKEFKKLQLADITLALPDQT